MKRSSISSLKSVSLISSETAALDISKASSSKSSTIPKLPPLSHPISNTNRHLQTKIHVSLANQTSTDRISPDPMNWTSAHRIFLVDQAYKIPSISQTYQRNNRQKLNPLKHESVNRNSMKGVAQQLNSVHFYTLQPFGNTPIVHQPVAHNRWHPRHITFPSRAKRGGLIRDAKNMGLSKALQSTTQSPEYIGSFDNSKNVELHISSSTGYAMSYDKSAAISNKIFDRVNNSISDQ